MSLLETVFAAEEALPGNSSPTRRMSSTMSRAAQPAAASTASDNGAVATATPGNGTATAAAVCNGATASTGENQAPASSKGKCHATVAQWLATLFTAPVDKSEILNGSDRIGSDRSGFVG